MATCPLCGQHEPDYATRCSACGKELEPAVAAPAAAPAPRIRSASAFKGTLVMPPPAASGPAANRPAAPAPPPPAAAPPPAPGAAKPATKNPALGATIIGGMVAPPPMAAPPAPAGKPLDSAAAAPSKPSSELDRTVLDLGLPQPTASSNAAILSYGDTLPAPASGDEAASAQEVPTAASPAEEPHRPPPAPRLEPAPAETNSPTPRNGGVLWLIVGFMGMLAFAALAVLAAKFMGYL